MPQEIGALTYEETTQNDFFYNISNFYLKDDDIIINGWGATGKHQHLTGEDTHEYSIELKNKSNGKIKVFTAKLLDIDKTKLLKATQETRLCTEYFSNEDCYYNNTKVGFEFTIPISELDVNAEYDIKLRIFEKQVNKGYQLSIYALGIDDSYKYNGVRYQLYSDVSKTNVTLLSRYLFVRSGPGQNYSVKTSNISCSVSGNALYWDKYGFFSNIIDAEQNNPGHADSELWVNMKYDLGACDNGKARAVNGTSDSGWGAWIYMIGGGTPATIKTTALNTITIDELRAYTAKKNTNTKALLTLTSTKNQNITIKAYHNNNLVYNKNHNISGTKTFEIKYNIPNDATLKIDVIDEYKKTSISSKIYVASEKTYIVDKTNQSGIITVDTPILVVTDRNGKSTEYKEKIQLSAIPYEIDISQGRGIKGITSAVSYWYPLEEFSLNSDYSVYALYPSQEETLSYEVIDGKVKVDLKKDNVERNNNYDISYFYHPNILLSLIDGKLYADELEGYDYYNGGGIWYPSWNDKIGTYDYQYVGTNLGVNKITIKRDLSYSITSTMFGKENSKFYIKRVDNPTNLNVIFKKKFSYSELIDYVRGLD